PPVCVTWARLLPNWAVNESFSVASALPEFGAVLVWVVVALLVPTWMLPELFVPAANLLVCVVVRVLRSPAWSVAWLLVPFVCMLSAVLGLPIWVVAELLVRPAMPPFCWTRTPFCVPIETVA